MAVKVDFDTRALAAGVKQLGDGIARGAPAAARKAAEDVAGRLRQATPVRTGTLAASIGVVADPAGFGVSYGADVDYARPVAARTGNVAEAIAGIPDAYGRDCQNMAATQVRRL